MIRRWPECARLRNCRATASRGMASRATTMQAEDRRRAFPEQQGIAVEQRRRTRSRDGWRWDGAGRTGIPTGSRSACLDRDAPRLPERRVDPDRDLTVVVENGGVSQFSTCDLRPRFRDLRAIGQLSRQHLIGDDSEREQVRARRALARPENIPARCIARAQWIVALAQPRASALPPPTVAEIDDLHRSGACRS